MGKFYVNTAAQLEHHHDPEGRPDLYVIWENGRAQWMVCVALI